MSTARRGMQIPARWRLFACGLFLLAGCLLASRLLPAPAEGWMSHLSRAWAGPLELNPDAALPVPTRISRSEFISNSTEGLESPFRRELKASIPAEFDDVLAFYRTELTKRGWQEQTDGAAGAAERAELNYASPEGPVTLKLSRDKDETIVDLVQRNTDAAAKANVLPPPGQARLIFGYLARDVASLAINDRTIPIAGGFNHPQTLDLPPGTYSYKLRLSDLPVQTETITVAAGEAWNLKLGSDGEKPSQIY